jgi:EAL domain-containing protein (putative c-di-GMP-specific phosphodiesterase class I)
LPTDFISLAEERGLIVPLGRWVLGEACRQVRAWHQVCPAEPPLTLNVNLSPRQFQDPDLLQDIRDALTSTTLDPRTQQVEITESMTMDRSDATLSVLQALTALGIRIAIDDFGAGHSALGYLKHFSVDALKIDQSFVNGLGRVREDTAIVRAVLAFARALGVQVTAEGIETAEQCMEPRTLLCDRGQGYLFARRLPPDELRAMLDRSTLSLHGATFARRPSSAA